MTHVLYVYVLETHLFIYLLLFYQVDILILDMDDQIQCMYVHPRAAMLYI